MPKWIGLVCDVRVRWELEVQVICRKGEPLTEIGYLDSHILFSALAMTRYRRLVISAVAELYPTSQHAGILIMDLIVKYTRLSSELGQCAITHQGSQSVAMQSCAAVCVHGRPGRPPWLVTMACRYQQAA